MELRVQPRVVEKVQRGLVDSVPNQVDQRRGVVLLDHLRVVAEGRPQRGEYPVEVVDDFAVLELDRVADFAVVHEGQVHFGLQLDVVGGEHLEQLAVEGVQAPLGPVHAVEKGVLLEGHFDDVFDAEAESGHDQVLELDAPGQNETTSLVHRMQEDRVQLAAQQIHEDVSGNVLPQKVVQLLLQARLGLDVQPGEEVPEALVRERLAAALVVGAQFPGLGLELAVAENAFPEPAQPGEGARVYQSHRPTPYFLLRGAARRSRRGACSS